MASRPAAASLAKVYWRIPVSFVGWWSRQSAMKCADVQTA